MIYLSAVISRVCTLLVYILDNRQTDVSTVPSSPLLELAGCRATLSLARRNRLDRQDWRCGERYRVPSITGPSSLISIKSATSLIHPSTYRNREFLDQNKTLFYPTYKSTP